MVLKFDADIIFKIIVEKSTRFTRKSKSRNGFWVGL